VVVKEVRWVQSFTQPAEAYIIFHGNGNAKYHLGAGFSYIWDSYQQLRDKIS